MPRRSSREIREQILQVANELIHERGYRGVSMEQIATAAGLKKANLFHYYPTKEALARAVFGQVADGFRERISRELADTGRDPIAVVGAMFSEAASGMTASSCCRGCFLGNLALELSDQHEGIREVIAGAFRFWTGRLERFLEASRDRGFFRAELQPGPAATAIVSLFEGAMLLSKASKEATPLEDARQMALSYLSAHANRQ